MRILGDRIAIKLDEVDEMTDGGIILPDEVKKKQKDINTGTVVALGQGKLIDGNFQAIDLNTGDKITFFPRSGINVTVNGEDLTILDMANVLLVE